MKSKAVLLVLVTFSAFAHSHSHSGLNDKDNGLKEAWQTKYGPQIDLPFTGPLAFSHLPYTRCLDDASKSFDIAILGMPFDTGVTYRPGARFGPFGIRSGSRRQSGRRGYTLAWGSNPYEQGFNILDCGDVRSPSFRIRHGG
jgi:agmatinase